MNTSREGLYTHIQLKKRNHRHLTDWTQDDPLCTYNLFSVSTWILSTNSYVKEEIQQRRQTQENLKHITTEIAPLLSNAIC